MKTSLLQTFVVHRVASALPVQYLHNLATLAHENIDVSVGRVEANHAHPATHGIHYHPHVARIPGHHNAIVLIQTKHTFFAAK